MRDDFNKPIRELLAQRVAYRCSYPNCPAITVGPATGSDQKIVTGEAAHITAASPRGPRFDPSLTSSQRSAAANGIWMCAYHAGLIDKDQVKYAPDTLRLWKQQAELRARNELENTTPIPSTTTHTLIAITHKIIFYGVWKKAEEREWTFQVGNFVEGSQADLKRYFLRQNEFTQFDRFIIVESEGEGREMEKFSWELTSDQQYEIICTILPPAPRIRPEQVGADIDMHMRFVDGDIAIVEGLDAALQRLYICLSTPVGSIFYARESGSHLHYFFDKYAGDKILLERLIKLELSRLLTVKVNDDIKDRSSLSPELNFISRVLGVQLLTIKPVNHMVTLQLHLEWGDGSPWQGKMEFCTNPNSKIEDIEL
jgi:hypothetical protein